MQRVTLRELARLPIGTVFCVADSSLGLVCGRQLCRLAGAGAYGVWYQILGLQTGIKGEDPEWESLRLREDEHRWDEQDAASFLAFDQVDVRDLISFIRTGQLAASIPEAHRNVQAA